MSARLRRQDAGGLVALDFCGGGAENNNSLQMRQACVEVPLGPVSLRAGSEAGGWLGEGGSQWGPHDVAGEALEMGANAGPNASSERPGAAACVHAHRQQALGFGGPAVVLEGPRRQVVAQKVPSGYCPSPSGTPAGDSLPLTLWK